MTDTIKMDWCDGTVACECPDCLALPVVMRIAAKDVVVGDELWDDKAANPAFRWNRIRQITHHDAPRHKWVTFETFAYSQAKHPEEGVTIRRKEPA